MSQDSSPLLILSAVRALYPAMRSILSQPVWGALRSRLDESLPALYSADSAAQQREAAKVIQLMAANEGTRSLLAARLAAQKTVLPSAVNLLTSLSGGAGRVPDVAQLVAIITSSATIEAGPSSNVYSGEGTDRTVFLHKGGIAGGKDVKLSNLALDFGELLKLGSSTLVAIPGIASGHGTIAIAAAVLGLVNSFYSGIVKSITEDQASVFWALIAVAAGRVDKTATSAELNKALIAERNKYGLKALDKAEVLRTLRQLSDLKAIQPAKSNSWILVESFSVR